MLVLTRRVGQELVIDKQIRIVVASVRGKRVQLNICAPTSVHIRRHELEERPQLAPGSSAAGPRRRPTSLAEAVVRVRQANQTGGTVHEG
jgi:carbon storage regulator